MNTADLELFVRIAETGSITRAARQLEQTPAAASAALKRLEQALGMLLFVRSTRRLRLTEAGERYLLHCRQALAALEAGRAALDAGRGAISGTLRLAVPSDLGRNVLLPWLDPLLAQHPGLSLQLSVSDALSDFYLDRIDLAIRYGEPADSALVAFPLITVDRVICAAPRYLERRGVPQTPQQLQGHNCLCYRLSSGLYDQWEFVAANGGSQRVRVTGDRSCDDADIVRRWAVAGQGIVYKSRLDVAVELSCGQLVRLLPEYPTPPLAIYLVCPSRQQVTPAVLALRDLLRQRARQWLAAPERRV